MSTVLIEEELLKVGRVYGSDDEEEEVPGVALDDDLLSDAGFEVGIFDDEEEEEDPFTPKTSGDEEDQ